MAEFATLARPYARAAFETARADGDDGLSRFADMLAFLAAAAGTPELAEELSSPSRSPDGKAELLVSLAGDALSDKGQNLVRVLAENKRLELLGEIHAQFEALKDEFERTLEVEVISARALDDAALSGLGDRLAARFDKQITLSSRVDATLLGGAVIRAGDMIIDGSIRGRLDKLAETLRAT
ncbi:MAG TPA: F0F1 ATP synthase subunit delta [Pseudomonadales bacterium]|nr:F0F1 ATP synthase subunit delta [Pseudomonadales bacterium]